MAVSLRHLALAALLALPVPLAGMGLPAAAFAQTAPDAARMARLLEAMQLGPLLAVMREEGISGGEGLDRDMLGGAGGVPLRADVARIYDPATARAEIEQALSTALSPQPETLARIEAFYASPLGQKVAGLEVEARRAFLDPRTQEAARYVWSRMEDAQDRRVAALTYLVLQTDLIERNVKNRMTTGLAFYRGLREGGGIAEPMTDQQVMSDLASSAGMVRGEVADWLYPYLALAYEPLSDQELQDYIAFLTSPEGMVLDQAVFAAFGDVFNRVSHDLGLAVSRRMAGQDI